MQESIFVHALRDDRPRFLSAMKSMLASVKIRRGNVFKMERILLKRLVALTWSLLVLINVANSAASAAQIEVRQFHDKEYGYEFQYPTNWKIRPLPEGQANNAVRVMLQGPNAGSFTVVIDKVKTLKKSDFVDPSERTRRVDEMMQQTIAQIYRSISASIKALKMKVGERRDLSNEFGVKFYIATLHTMKEGKPIIVAGIHSFPFDKDYSINFTMTTFWDPAAAQENEMMTGVFNSFRLRGEPPAGGDLKTRPEGKREN
jgi:hypothetical protein